MAVYTTASAFRPAGEPASAPSCFGTSRYDPDSSRCAICMHEPNCVEVLRWKQTPFQIEQYAIYENEDKDRVAVLQLGSDNFAIWEYNYYDGEEGEASGSTWGLVGELMAGGYRRIR